MTVERKHAMTRLGAGDYLLPSNDGGRLWRIRRYTEDGSAEAYLPGGGTRPIIGQRWSASVHRLPLEDALQLDVEELLGGGWDEWAHLLRTRADAIRAALSARP